MTSLLPLSRTSFEADVTVGILYRKRAREVLTDISNQATKDPAVLSVFVEDKNLFSSHFQLKLTNILSLQASLLALQLHLFQESIGD